MEGGLEKGWWYRIVSDFARIVDGTFSIKLLRPRPVKEYSYQGDAYLEVYNLPSRCKNVGCKEVFKLFPKYAAPYQKVDDQFMCCKCHKTFKMA